MLLQVVAACYLLLGAAGLFWVAARGVHRAVITWPRHTDAIWSPPSHPIAVATLIHGTWARAARWTRADAPLGAALREAFGERVALFRFAWSGHNRARARERAAERLQAHLRGLRVRYPDARHYVIAHSHAGNIVMYALRDVALGSQLHGVVCLSTPFLHVRRRRLGAITNATLAAALVVGLWVVGATALQRLGVTEDLAVLGSLIAAGAIAYGMVGWSRRAAERLLRVLTLPDALSVPCLILRASGDEAGAVLGFVRLLNWLVALCWIAPAGVAAEVVAVIKAWGVLARRYWRPATLCAIAGGAVLATDWQSGPFLPASPEIRGAAGIASVAALVSGVGTLLIWWLGSGAGLYGYALGFAAAGLVVSPLILLFALLIAPFGPDLALACVHLDITAEATPPGTWTLHHLRGAPGAGEPRAPGLESAYGLMHGTHASPQAIRILVD
jgi:hypothetical protein